MPTTRTAPVAGSAFVRAARKAGVPATIAGPLDRVLTAAEEEITAAGPTGARAAADRLIAACAPKIAATRWSELADVFTACCNDAVARVAA